MRVKKGYLQSQIVKYLHRDTMTLDQIVAGVIAHVPPENALRTYERLIDKAARSRQKYRVRRRDAGMGINEEYVIAHQRKAPDTDGKIWQGARRLIYDAMRPLIEKGVLIKHTNKFERNPRFSVRTHNAGNDITTSIAAHSPGR